jgi:hypothetical protein
MPLVKINRKILNKPEYDIAHTINGTFTINNVNYIYIGADTYQGPNYNYKLFNYTNLVIDASLGTISNAIQVILPESVEQQGYEATAKISNNTVYASISKPTYTTYDIAHTVSGSLTFGGKADIFINDDQYQGPGLYKLFKGFNSVSGWEYLNMVSHAYTRGFRVNNNEISIRLN